VKSNESISRKNSLVIQQRKRWKIWFFWEKKKIHKTTNNDVQVFHSYFCYLHSSISRKNYKTHTQTTTRKFISDNNLNKKTTKKFINCIIIKNEREDFWVDEII